jgi:AraC-like DNA-binding protein
MSFDMEERLHLAVRPTVELLERIAEGSSRRARWVLDAISRGFHEPGYSVARLKNALSVNDRNLTEFALEMGIAAGQLIIECRMEAAFRLFRDTLLTVDQIAYLVGYNSRRTFEVACRRWCGLPPAELRARLRRGWPRLSALPEEVFSWHFAVRYERGEVSDAERGRVADLIREIQGLS